MVFDVETAFLRRIRLENREALRGIYAAVRDQNWRTVPPNVMMVEENIGERSFRLVFDVTAVLDEIDFRWRGRITGHPSGTVRYEMEGRAHSAFLRNRIGFCVLHPIRECAGEPCRVEHADGSVEDARFPRAISPHQPIFDIGALTYSVDPEQRVEIRFEGDVFEMEDQRNWTDASFKTYCTPLSLPMPVQVNAGDVVEQAVTLRWLGDSVRHSPADPHIYPTTGPVELGITSGTVGVLPSVGLRFGDGVRDGAQQAADSAAAGSDDALRPDHLRIDLSATDPDPRDRIAAATERARRLESSLLATLRMDADARPDSLRKALNDVRPPISDWLVLDADGVATSEATIRAARDLLSPSSPSARVGGGTMAYFTELNRDRPAAELLDFVCYAVTPQVHAFDALSMMETLPIQGETVVNVRRFMDGLPVYVSPITLRPSFNPDEAAESNHARGFDPRQNTAFGAAWTLGSLIYLTRAGATAVTYFDTVSIAGSLRDLLRYVCGLKGVATHQVASSDPERIVALLVAGTPSRLLVTNLTPESQTASLSLDDKTDTSVIRCIRDNIRLTRRGSTLQMDLPPYAWTALELGT